MSTNRYWFNGPYVFPATPAQYLAAKMAEEWPWRKPAREYNYLNIKRRP